MNPIKIEVGQVFWKHKGVRPYLVTEIIDLDPGPHSTYSAKIKLKSAMKRHTEYLFIKKGSNTISISELRGQGFWHTLGDVDTARKHLKYIKNRNKLLFDAIDTVEDDLISNDTNT